MMRFPTAFVAAVSLACTACTAKAPAAPVPEAPSAKLLPVHIKTAKGEIVYSVEVARTEEEQERGLMFRTSLPPRGGMLFPFRTQQIATFWMKNTVIPLDMLFIRKNGTIARIAVEAIPYSLAPIGSGEPVSAVLEIAGGAAAADGISEGDRVSWTSSPQN